MYTTDGGNYALLKMQGFNKKELGKKYLVMNNKLRLKQSEDFHLA